MFLRVFLIDPPASEPGLSNCTSKQVSISSPRGQEASKQPSTGKCPLEWRRAQVLGMKGESFESSMLDLWSIDHHRPFLTPRLVCLLRQKLTTTAERSTNDFTAKLLFDGEFSALNLPVNSSKVYFRSRVDRV